MRILCETILAAVAAAMCAAEAKEHTLVDEHARATPAGRRRREMVRAFAALRRDNPAMTAPGQKWLDNDKPESVLSLRRIIPPCALGIRLFGGKMK